MSNITIKDSKYLHKFAKFSLRRLIGEIWIFFLIFKTHRNCPTKLSLPCVLLYMCVAITIWHLNQPWNIITQLLSQRQQPSVYLIYSWEDIFHHHNNNNNGNVNCNNHHLRVFALMPIVCAVLNDLIRQREMRNFYFFLCLLLCHSSVFTFFYEYFFTQFRAHTVGGGRYRLWWLVKVIRWLTNWVEMMRSRRVLGDVWKWCDVEKIFIADKRNPIIKKISRSTGFLHTSYKTHWSISNAYLCRKKNEQKKTTFFRSS